MAKSKTTYTSISGAENAEEIGQFWNDHSLADHWEETREAELVARAERPSAG